MNNKIRVNGFQTFWRLPSHFDRDVLLGKLDELGYKRHCPKKRSNSSALKEALQHIVRSWDLDDVWVRDLDNVDEDGYVVKRETKGATDNEYETWFRTKWETPSDDVEPFTVTVDGLFSADNTAINLWFRHFRKRIVSHSVAKMLSVLIQDHLGGVPLKPSGGFYWLPDESREQYEKIVQAVVAAADGKCKIYRPEFDLADESAVEAVKDAIIDDINKRADIIEAQAKKAGVKEKALEGRKTDAEDLHARVKQYEEFVGETLDECRKVAKRCEKTVVDKALSEFPDFFGVTKQAAESPQTNEPLVTPDDVTSDDVNPFAVT